VITEVFIREHERDVRVVPIIRWFLDAVCSACAAYAQGIGVGANIGTLASEAFTATSVSTAYSTFVTSTGYFPSNLRLTVGPMVELPLPRGFAVEVSALSRPASKHRQSASPRTVSASSAKPLY